MKKATNPIDSLPKTSERAYMPTSRGRTLVCERCGSRHVEDSKEKWPTETCVVCPQGFDYDVVPSRV